MILQEMGLEMTIPEACFQAEDATDCYAAWHTYVSSRFLSPAITPMRLTEAISMLIKEKFEEYSLHFEYEYPQSIHSCCRQVYLLDTSVRYLI